MLHDSTGLNATVSASMDNRNRNFSPDDGGGHDDGVQTFYKLGWIAQFGSWGPTAFSGDYTRTWNRPTDRDDGHAAGATVVQHFAGWGTEIYMQYRWMDLDRSGADFEPINVGSVGVRVKF